eukprot:XP_001707770.1 Hypothetical protein GL50803_38528 [Giardia lamblia ATCC 50803]
MFMHVRTHDPPKIIALLSGAATWGLTPKSCSIETKITPPPIPPADASIANSAQTMATMTSIHTSSPGTRAATPIVQEI